MAKEPRGQDSGQRPPSIDERLLPTANPSGPTNDISGEARRFRVARRVRILWRKRRQRMIGLTMVLVLIGGPLAFWLAMVSGLVSPGSGTAQLDFGNVVFDGTLRAIYASEQHEVTRDAQVRARLIDDVQIGDRTARLLFVADKAPGRSGYAPFRCRVYVDLVEPEQEAPDGGVEDVLDLIFGDNTFTCASTVLNEASSRRIARSAHQWAAPPHQQDTTLTWAGGTDLIYLRASNSPVNRHHRYYLRQIGQQRTGRED